MYKRANKPDAHGHKLAKWLADFGDRAQAVHYVSLLPKDEPVSPGWEGYTTAVAVQAMYLMAGANAEMRDRDIDLSDVGGHIGFADDKVAYYAKMIVDFLEAPNRKDLDFPGVFEYEVTEGLGRWLAGNFHCVPVQFERKLEHEFTKFIMGKDDPPAASMAEIDAALSPGRLVGDPVAAWPFTGEPNT